MKKLIGWAAGLIFAAIVIGTGVFLYKKSQKKPVISRRTPATTT